MKYQFNLGNDELVTIEKNELQEFTANNPNAKFDDFVNEDDAGNTDPSPEKKDAPVEENKIASDTESTSVDGSSGSIENQTENNCPDGQVKGADGECYDPKAENTNEIAEFNPDKLNYLPKDEIIEIAKPKANAALYKNYHDAVEVDDEEIEEMWYRKYFGLDEIDKRRNQDLVKIVSMPSHSSGYGAQPVTEALPYSSQEVRNLIPLSKIEDYDKWLKGELKISPLDMFATEKLLKEDKADDFFKKLSPKERANLENILSDKNLQIDSLKEVLDIKSNEVDELVKQSEKELGPIENRMVEINNRLERIYDIYSGSIVTPPSDETVKEFNTLKTEYEMLASQRREIIGNYTTEFEGYNKTLEDYRINAADYTGNIAGLESAKKNYNILSQFGHQLDKQVIASGYTLLGKFGPEIEKNSFNYNLKASEEIENFPRRLKVEEVKDANTFGRFVVETLTDHGLSMVAAMIPYFGKILKGGKYLNTARWTSLGLFGVSSGGAQMFDMEKRDFDISERLKQIDTALDKEGISREEYSQLTLEKNELENIIPYTEFQKIILPVFKAGSEILTERLGSMRFVESLAGMGKVLDAMDVEKAIWHALKQIPTGVVIEEGEEIVNLALGNIAENLVLREGQGHPLKSVFDGVTPDMLAKTAVTALVIGGPGHYNNIKGIVKRQLMTNAERKKLNDKAEEYIQLMEDHENKNIDRKEFNEKRRELLKDMDLDQMVSLNKLNHLSIDDLKELGLINLEISNLLKRTATGAGNTRTSSEYRDRQFDKNKEEYERLIERREALLGKAYNPEGKEFTPDQAFIYGLYQMSIDIAESKVPKNGQLIVLDEKSREEAIEKMLQNAKEGGPKVPKWVLDGIRTNNAFQFNNNIYVNHDLILASILSARSNKDMNALFAAVSPVHELFHIKIGADKIIINNKLQGDLKYAARGLKTTLREKYESGRITNKEAYDAILARLDSYSKRKGKGGKLDIEEYFTTIFDAYTLGLITDSDIDLDYAMKTIVEKALSIMHPNSNIFGRINTTRDAFNYIKSFNKQALTSKANILGKEEDDKQEIKFSENILGLYDQYGKDHVAMIEEGSKLNKDGEFVEDITKSEFGQSIGGLVQKITKDLFDPTLPDNTKVIDPIRSKARAIFQTEVTQDAAMMILNEYKPELGSIGQFTTSRLYKRVQNKLRKMGVMPSEDEGGLGMATEATDATLKDQKQTEQQEDKITDPKDEIKLKRLDTKISFKRKKPKKVKDKDGNEKTILVDEFTPMNEIEIPGETVTEIIDGKKITRPKTLSDKVLEAVIKTFQTTLPKVNEKEFRSKFDQANQAEIIPLLQEEFAVVKDKDKNRVDKFRLFLQEKKNFEGILGKLPQSVINKRFKTLGKKTGRETLGAGKGIFEKLNVTQKEFIEYFSGRDLASNVRSDRKKSLIIALANELAFDATLDAISDPNVIKKLGIQGVIVNNAWTDDLLKTIERGELDIDNLEKSNEAAGIKFSNFLGELNNQGLDLNYAYDFVETFKADRGKAGDKNMELYQSLLDDENIAIKWKAFETEVLNNLTAASAKIPGLKVVSTEVAANNNNFIDMQLVANGNKIGIEVKLNARARVGTAARIYQDKDGNLVIKSPEGINLEGLLDSNNPQIVEFKKLFQEWLDIASESEDKKIQMNEGRNGLTTIPLSPKTSAALKKSGLQAKIGRTYVEIPIQIVLDYYINKDKKGYLGEYIMLNNKLYSLGNDPLNTNAPKLDSNVTVNIRLRGDAIEPDRHKPENERLKTYRISAEVRLKDKNGKWNVNDSNIELNTPKDYVNTFSNIKFSKNLEDEMHGMIGRTKGIDVGKMFSEPQARRLGKKAERIRLFVPNTAEDLLGLTYRFLGKGKQGDKDIQFFKKNLFTPLTEANIKFEAEQVIAERYLKEAKDIIEEQGIDLTEEALEGYTNDHVIRIFMWNRRGFKVPGLDPDNKENEPGPEQAKMVRYARQNYDILAIADAIEAAYPDSQYGKPSKRGWVSGTITTDLLEHTNEFTRQKIYKKFFNNVQGMFGKFDTSTGRLTGPIANKIRAMYGNTFMKALESSMYRIYTGRNRAYTLDPQGGIMLDWMNNAIGNIMFINSRSAVLQTISHMNFTNWSDNNPLEIGKRWADHKQFTEDFKMIFFSDYLKARRGGLRTDVQEQEIAEAAKNSKNDIRSMIAVVLKKGFMPTQYADSFAIALGGASFYRNRYNTYIQKGMSKKKAQEKAFAEMREIAEDTQQSGRPEKISMEQAGLGGRLILAFQNTPMQYNRLMKRAIQDLYNGRGDFKTNLSKIIYYGGMQNALFYALQQGLFAVIFDEPETTEEEEKEKNRYYRWLNGMSDSILRGSGIFGAVVSTGKNTLLKVLEREGFDEKAIEEIANLSPPLGKKTRQLFDIRDKFQYKQNKEKIKELGLDTRNPAILAAADAISFGINLPTDRALKKMNNLRTAMEKETEMWQRIALVLGWSNWELNIEDDTNSPFKGGFKGGFKEPKFK